MTPEQYGLWAEYIWHQDPDKPYHGPPIKEKAKLAFSDKRLYTCDKVNIIRNGKHAFDFAPKKIRKLVGEAVLQIVVGILIKKALKRIGI